MEYNQIRCFLKVAELEHVSHAAAELGISQPNLSKTIRVLEQELGCKLFDRDGRGIRLNDNGKIFWRHAKNSVQELEEGVQKLQNRSREQSELVLSILSGYLLLPQFFRIVQERMPRMKIRIVREGLGQASPSWDLMIYSSSSMPKGEDEILLHKEELYLHVSKEHPLAQYDSVNLKEIAGEPIIVINTAGTIGDVVDDYCRQAGFAPNIIMNMDNGQLTRELVAMNLGVSFSSELARSMPGTKTLKICQPTCFRYLILKCRNPSGMVQQAVEIMGEVCGGMRPVG